MKRTKSFWIKERQNPQLGTYYVACGQLPKTEARRIEKTLYGVNFMHEYQTKDDYNSKLAELKAKGERVQ